MIMQSSTDAKHQFHQKDCPECGQNMLMAQTEFHLQECDRCLSKKEE
jgi:ribosomal protein S27AE